MSQYERNHDGAALGASHHVLGDEQRTIYPYTVQGGATLPDRQEILRRQSMIHTTYLYLGVAVAGCMGGAWMGSHSIEVLNFLLRGGFVMALMMFFLLNIMSRVALKVAENSSRLAVPALGAFGLFAGFVISPLVALGLDVSGNSISKGQDLVSTALVITGAVFAAVTAYIFLNKKEIAVPRAMGWAIFGFFFAAIPLSYFSQSSVVFLAISGIFALIGVYQIAVGTSQLATNPNFNSPAAGALILFAGVFNTFTSILEILIFSRD